MEVKLRIIEINPKIQLLKNNPKDIISISFFSNHISTKIDDIENIFITNEKIIVNLGENDPKNKIIKCVLLKNNNIIASGEFNLKEGINWYKLNEVKNYMMSKESLITSSTSNENFQILNESKNLVFNNYSPNSLDTKISIENNKYFSPKNVNSIKTGNIKIKLLVIFLNRRNLSKNKKINDVKKQNDLSSKFKESSFELGNNYFDCSANYMDIIKLNPKSKLLTTEKKQCNIRKNIFFGNNQKKISQKKMNLNLTNKSGLDPIVSGDSFLSNKNKDNSFSISNNILKKTSKKKNNKNITSKNLINEKMKMKSSLNLFKKKNQKELKYSFDNKIINKKPDKKEKNHNKLNSCEIIEEKILDQTFKNNLKKDENLKANLSRNNSFTSFNRLNTELSKNSIENIKIGQDLYDTNRDYKDNNLENDHSGQNLNVSNVDDNINTNYENLKIDFLLLYSEDNVKTINDEDLFLEMQLMAEKILKLQHYHQKEYIQIYNIINTNKQILSDYQRLYLSITKKMNKLNLKKMKVSMNETNNSLYKENITNFIKVRKKIIKESEFPIWHKLMINSNKNSVLENYKNKMTNIFLNICSKKESKLNILSLKFYKEIRERQNKKANINKITKYKSLGIKKIRRIDTKINTNIKFNNYFLNKTSKNFYSNKFNLPSSKGKNNTIKLKHSSTRMTNNNKYGTHMNDITTNNIRKKNNQKKQLSVGKRLCIDKTYLNKKQ